MRVVGLTGGIGMGKSTAGAAFRRARVPVFDADAAVRRLQAPGGRAVAPLGAAFPDVLRDTPAGPAVDREALRRAVLGDPAALARLEGIVHPLVRDAERRFLAACRRRGEALAVLDVPLLLETGGAGRCDLVMVVSAPAAVQRARVLRRAGMTPARLDAILGRQLPDAARRRAADVVVRTGLSRRHAGAAVARLVARLQTGEGGR